MQVAILDCLGDAGEVVCAASACKALWTIAAGAQFQKVCSAGTSDASRLLTVCNVAGSTAVAAAWVQMAHPAPSDSNMHIYAPVNFSPQDT
jgi:hypothetical protein